jgi:hypothetical protein
MRSRAILTGLGAAASVLYLAGPAYPQAMLCNGAANCSNMGGTRTCTYMWNYTVMSYANTVNNMTGAATGCTVMGNNTARTFIAMRPTTAAPTGGCYFAGTFNVGGTFPYTCPLDMADGLPVELMEFSIDQGKPGR